MVQSIPNSARLYGSLSASIPIHVLQEDLIRRPDLTQSAKDVFALFWRAKHQRRHPLKRLYFGIPYIARELGISTRTVQRAIRLLESRGLITVIPRFRRNSLSPSSHEYRIHWTAYQAPAPPARIESAPRTTVEDGPQPILPPDAALAWPAVSPAPPTPCQEGPAAETPSQQGLNPDSAGPIENQESYAKLISTPALEGAPMYTFDSLDALRLFLFTHLKSRGVPTKRVLRWERQYGVLRVATVAVWALSAPVASIRAVGGWLDTALREDWSAPTWVQEACDKRRRQVERTQRQQAAIAAQGAAAADDARFRAAVAAQEAEDAVEWARLRARWDAVPKSVKDRAYALASADLGPSVGVFFSERYAVLWRRYHLAAARELWPEGLR